MNLKSKGRSRIVNLNRSWIGKILKNQLIAGSFVMMIGSLTSGFGNYLYHLLMGRMLGPVDYGVLASLISLTYLMGIPLGALNVVVVKYVSAWRGQKRPGRIVSFYEWLIQRLAVLGIGGVFLLLVFSPFLVSFLHLKTMKPLLVIIFSSLVGVYQTVNLAFLQGFLRFGLMAVLGTVQVIFKLGLAVFLVWLGLKVLGAVLALLVSGFLVFGLTTLRLKGILPKPEKKKGVLDWIGMKKYALPVFFSTLAFTSLYTTDIILARHFLDAQQAGFYAALAILGKIIYFVSLPIVLVMFPMVSERHANGGRYRPLLFASLGLVGLACLGITAVYFLLPGLMVRILFGSAYLAAASYLGFFGIFLSLYSFSFLLVNFYLSANRTGVVVFPIVASLAQIILISFFHASLFQVIKISILVTSLLLLSLMLYYYYDQTKTSLGYHSRL